MMSPVGAAAGCDRLILIFGANDYAKRSQPAAAPAQGIDCGLWGKVRHSIDTLAVLGQPLEAIRLQESPMNLVELTERLHAIRDRNDWRQFHSPKNLAMAASVEMSELVEIFQWLTEDQSRQLPAEKLAHAGQEVGDIVLYLLLLCSELGLDMNEVVRSKLADSERRFS
jgi:NTP pyrophosphatase (non-canonical NTP hydrolase)